MVSAAPTRHRGETRGVPKPFAPTKLRLFISVSSFVAYVGKAAVKHSGSEDNGLEERESDIIEEEDEKGHFHEKTGLMVPERHVVGSALHRRGSSTQGASLASKVCAAKSG